MAETLALLNAGPNRTGVGNYTASLVRNIPGGRWDVHLFNFSVFGSRALSDYPTARKHSTIYGLRPRRMGMLGLPVNYLLYHMGLLRKRLERAGQFSLYHATTGDLNHLAGISDRFIVTWHDVGFFRHQFSPYARFIKWNLSFAQQASHVIASSEYVRARLIQKVKRLPKRLSVVPLGVGEDFRPENKAEARRKLGLPAEGNQILSVGRDWYPKNIKTVIEAMDYLSDVKLIRIGKLSMSSKTWRQARNKENMILRDNVKDGDMVHYYNASDALVFPSILEGPGLEPLEAMKCGVPVITTRVGAMPELVGNNALFTRNPTDPVELAKLVTYLLDNKRLRDELRANGITRAAKFPWKESVRKTVDIYDQVLLRG